MKRVIVGLSVGAWLLFAGVAEAQTCPAGTTWNQQFHSCEADTTQQQPVQQQPVQQQPVQQQPVQQQPVATQPGQTYPIQQNPSMAQTTRSRPRMGLMISGIIMFAVMYGLTASVTATINDGGNEEFLYIPLAGPWIALGASGTDDWQPLIFPSGIVQLAGVTLFILGLTLRREVAVRADGGTGVPVADGWRLSPVVVPSSEGGTVGAMLSADL